MSSFAYTSTRQGVGARVMPLARETCLQQIIPGRLLERWVPVLAVITLHGHRPRRL